MPSENFNIKLDPRLTKKAQDYGFLLKIMNMICSLDETNRNLIRINQTWNRHSLQGRFVERLGLGAWGIRNEHDSAKFAGNFVARTSEAFPSFLHKKSCFLPVKVLYL